MAFQISEAESKAAQGVHNLFIGGVFFFDLLLTPGAIALKIGMAAFLIPLVLSGSLFAYIYARSRKSAAWFVQAHWLLAWQRCKLLLIGYAVTAAFLAAAWLLTMSGHDANMKHIMMTALSRIAVMPSLIMLMVTVVLEFSAQNQAGRGELPEKLVRKFPPPEGVVQRVG